MENAECRMQNDGQEAGIGGQGPGVRGRGRVFLLRFHFFSKPFSHQDVVGQSHLLPGPLRLCAFAQGSAWTFLLPGPLRLCAFAQGSAWTFLLPGPLRLCAFARGSARPFPTDEVAVIIRVWCQLTARPALPADRCRAARHRARG
jgi:hypothetical protein